VVLRRRHPAGFAELPVKQRFAGVLPAALVCRRMARRAPENRSDLFSAGCACLPTTLRKQRKQI
jgi:hypothetical protein